MQNKKQVIELQDKANKILEMAIDMDKRVERYSDNQFRMKQSMFPELSEVYKQKAETAKLGSKRLWQAYLNILTQIKLEL